MAALTPPVASIQHQSSSWWSRRWDHQWPLFKRTPLSLALSLPLAYGAPAFWLTPLMWIDQNSRFVSFFHPVWSRDPKPHSAPLSFSYSAG